MDTNENIMNEDAVSADTDTEGMLREKSYFREMNYDRLTGLPSMTYFFKLAEVGRNNMHSQDIASVFAYIDFKGMKYYNSKYGFAEGDTLIKEFAAVLADAFGKENCSRFGQDHFAVFTRAEGLQDKLKKVFRDARHLNGGKSLPVRAGIYPDSMGLVEVSLACDRAKYASKARPDTNSSYFNYYDDRMLSRELNRQYIVDNIDRAIEENWVTAFYQPIVRTTNRKVCDEEALARWIDPEKGMLSPADFIPILEDTKLIYKVDLHIVDTIIKRIKYQLENGITCAPISINLSRTDFETCDIVEEINSRFEAAGVDKELITVEITESVVGGNFEFMKERITRFQELGFKVWMDDFGSGYSSLDLLQEMQFDLIKFDMRFMRQFETSPRSRVILTELMRMVQSLGIESICEGVETTEQADFLGEIGCTKMQGYFFSKPTPIEDIWDKIRNNGMKFGYENPDETLYYRTIGTINLYDMGSIANEESEGDKRYFDTIPMAIYEYNGKVLNIVRSNKSYREFLSRYIWDGYNGSRGNIDNLKLAGQLKFVNIIKECAKAGHSVFLDDKMTDGSSLHAMVRKVVDNPVTGLSAYALVILDITPDKDDQVTFANVAEALSSDYIYLYHVNIETGKYIEYSHDSGGRGLSAERRGDDFFAEARRDIMILIYEEDRDGMYEKFTKDNIMKNVDENGSFVFIYRLMMEGTPTYVNMKIVRMAGDDKHIIIGVNNVDAQMRQQETIERLKEETITYSRISALMGDFLAIYTVDPASGYYMQYSALKEFADMPTTSRAGVDFFEDALKDIKGVIHPDDLDHFLSVFSKEKILDRVGSGGVYNIHYRLMINGEPTMVSLRAGLVREKDGEQLIVGISKASDDDLKKSDGEKG